MSGVPTATVDDRIEQLANELAKNRSSDVLLFNGGISQRSSADVVQAVIAARKRENIFLVLVTPGGDPDAAFKIGRSLQNKYSKVEVFVPGWCKSAGTLIAIAAHNLFIGDRGELGPLDMQIAKSDEIAEYGSGLTVDEAMSSLSKSAQKMFIEFMLDIRRDTGSSITTRTASELASSMVTKLLEPIYAQIDPMKIGENSRAMSIAKAYGIRLATKSQNLASARSLDYLVSSYPSHGFVIDLEEARVLFRSVQEPDVIMQQLAVALGDVALVPKNRAGDGRATVKYISTDSNSGNRSEENVGASPEVRGKGAPRSRARKRNGGSPGHPGG